MVCVFHSGHLLSRAVKALRWEDQFGVTVTAATASTSTSNNDTGTEHYGSTPAMQLSAPSSSGLLQSLSAVHLICDVKAALCSTDSDGAPTAPPTAYTALYEAAAAPTSAIIEAARCASIIAVQ